MEGKNAGLSGRQSWSSVFSSRRLKHVLQTAIFSALVCLLMLSLWRFHDLSKARTPTTTGDLYPETLEIYTDPDDPTALSPRELMSRPLSTDPAHVPRLLHQSWKTSKLPDKFKAWSKTCLIMNPGWQYVLWTDEDNEAMVAKYVPWFLSTYKGLKAPIERADTSRNLYMHIFGGVYADLDTECLRPYDALFKSHGVSTVPWQRNAIRPEEGTELLSQRKAFLGQMHEDKEYHSGLPNAWMASTPAHPFWILPLEFVFAHSWDWKTPEWLTGPDALFEVVKVYNHKYTNESSAELDKYYMKSTWGEIHGAHPNDALKLPQRLEVLEPSYVFPFNWANLSTRAACWGGDKSTFKAQTCKNLLQVDERGSYSISYFSHSWDGDPFYG